jgi:hypothetical protein
VRFHYRKRPRLATGRAAAPTLRRLVGAPRTLFEAETTPVWNPLNLIGVMPA